MMFGISLPKAPTPAADDSPVRQVLQTTLARVFENADGLPKPLMLSLRAGVRGLTDDNARSLVRAMVRGVDGIVAELEAAGVNVSELLADDA